MNKLNLHELFKNISVIFLLHLMMALKIFSADSIEFFHDNDLFITDEYYTSGVELKYKHMSTLDNDIYYNFSFGQKFYTPSDITDGSEGEYDRPYAAWLYMGYEKEKIKENSIKKYGIQLGITGPDALGEMAQNTVHDIINEEFAAGWKDQIEEIWGIQYYNSTLKEKYLKKENNDIVSFSEHIEYEVGNVFTNVKYGGLFLMGNKSFYLQGDRDWNYYFYFEPQIQLTLYDATLRGSMYSNGSPLVKNTNAIVLKSIFGASIEHKNFEFRYMLNLNSTEITDMPWKFVNHIYSRFNFVYKL